MIKLDWPGAEELLFERSQAILRRFGLEHPEEPVSLFFYTVDSEVAGVALNFDTPANSLHGAQAHQRREIEYRNQLFASERGWQQSHYFVAHPTRQIDDFNRHGSCKYELFEFVELAAWEDCFNGNEETSEKELEDRIVTALWRVTDRLVKAKAFDVLKRAAPFRIAFAFHDDGIVVLRILDWPRVGEEGPA